MKFTTIGEVQPLYDKAHFLGCIEIEYFKVIDLDWEELT